MYQRKGLQSGTRVFNVLPKASMHTIHGAYAIAAGRGSIQKATAASLANKRYLRNSFDESQLPTTRREAAIMGSRFYKLPTPCVHGHFSRRYTANTRCVMCIAVGAEIKPPNLRIGSN